VAADDSGGRSFPFPPGRVRRQGTPPPPRRCPPSLTTASLAWACALKAFLPSDVRVIRAAVTRSRWDPRRAAAWRRNRHTLAVEGKGGGGVSVLARYRLWHMSGPAGGGGGASAPSSAAAPALVFCSRRRRRVRTPSSRGAYRAGRGLSSGGPFPRTRRHAAQRRRRPDRRRRIAWQPAAGVAGARKRAGVVTDLSERAAGGAFPPRGGEPATSWRACRGRVLACCRGVPCLGLIAMTLDSYYIQIIITMVI